MGSVVQAYAIFSGSKQVASQVPLGWWLGLVTLSWFGLVRWSI